MGHNLVQLFPQWNDGICFYTLHKGIEAVFYKNMKWMIIVSETLTPEPKVAVL